jgi:uncharacterized protein (TIGR04255 family)
MYVRPIGNISPAPPFRLEDHRLAQVLCQIRFSPVLRIGEDDAVIPFQEAVRADYPRYVKQQGMNILITPAGVQQQTAMVGQHRFEDADGVFSAILTPEFVALQTSRYVDIDDFAGRVAVLARAVQEHYNPAEITRVGLRFINELRLVSPDPRVEMREAIIPALLGAAGSEELLPAVARVEQILELHGDDRARMVVRHGFQPNGGTTVEGTSVGEGAGPELAQPYYLLDIDAYCAEQALRYNVDGVEAVLREFNDDMRSFFAWAVKESYRREKLGQREI